jgi:hypothetical protein|tara:strand:- start:5996 stop:6667 length:672 start_codon:yes stop_codon:yes gene_type:complete
MYDIVFISYGEANADSNWDKLKQQYPMAKRVKDVKGIHQAHVAGAKKCFTKMFWVVDGDAQIVDDFKFDHEVSSYDLDCVHVWRAKNPVNGLEYGYGGVKLLPRMLTLKMDTTTNDMTTSISNKFKAMPSVSNITAFNTDPLSTWRGAFRECAKLASKTIQGQLEEETNDRLKTWTTHADGIHSRYALRGANAGMQFGLSVGADLGLINNFEWLEQQYANDSV